MELLVTILHYTALSRKLLLQIAPSSLLAEGPGSASTKVRFFEHLFLLQPNKKLLFGKYHSRIWLRNTINTHNRAFFRNISLLKVFKFDLKKLLNSI